MKSRLIFEVRFAEPADLDYCIESDFKHIGEAVLRRKIEEKAIVLAEVDERLIGYLRIEHLWLSVPFLSTIGVAEEYRRRGVGTAMIKFLEEHLSRRGHGALYSSSDANEPGPQAWHRKVGFEECGIIAGINEGGVGEVFFRKPLKPSI
jgi:ribosomal protein S18 acetylase RimI-like enzyme